MMDLSKLEPDHFALMGSYTKTIYRDVYPAISPSKPELSHKGKVVVITGATSGFGARGIVPAYAAAGAAGIVLVGRRADRLKEVSAGIKKSYPGVELLEVPTDVSDVKAIDALFAAVKSKFGRAPDVLVNNAGVQLGPTPVGASDTEKWWGDMDINLKGTYLATRAFIKELGEEKPGHVINISSGAATVILPGMSSYGISKLAATRLAEYVEAETKNVVCIALDPGTVKTDMVPEFLAKFAKDTPALVGGACVWLTSPVSSFLNGRLVMANWDVDELVARKEEIAGGNDLKFIMKGKFGVAA